MRVSAVPGAPGQATQDGIAAPDSRSDRALAAGSHAGRGPGRPTGGSGELIPVTEPESDAAYVIALVDQIRAAIRDKDSACLADVIRGLHDIHGHATAKTILARGLEHMADVRKPFDPSTDL